MINKKMSHFSFRSIKLSLQTALEKLSGFNQLNYRDRGKVIDKSFKSILTDLMQQFGMKPNIDYEDNLRDNEPSTDFVALTKSADDYMGCSFKRCSFERL